MREVLLSNSKLVEIFPDDSIVIQDIGLWDDPVMIDLDKDEAKKLYEELKMLFY